MDNSKRSAALKKKEHGIHKDKHINQYGDQSENGKLNKRDTSEKVDPRSSTISGRNNAVQENAHKNSANKAE